MNHYAISGTRTSLTDLDRALIRFVLRHHDLNQTEGLLHVGDCPTGVDDYVPEFTAPWPLDIKVHEADWTTHRKAAGPIRNREMLADRPVQAWAFPRKGLENKGTRDFIKACIERQIDVQVYWLWEQEEG